MSLALAFGCGKKINEPSTSENGGQRQNQDPPAVLTVQVDETVSTIKSYKLPRSGWFTFPTKLKVSSANALGKRVKIFYNLEDNGRYEYHCFYKSTSSTTELAFEKCETESLDPYMDSTSDFDGVLLPMDIGKTIKMQLTNPSGTGIKIDSVYIVEWK